MAVTLEAGDRAPSFTLKDQDGVTHKLADYKGKTVVLYFYPNDDTPGCTKEACSFRDEHDAIAEEGAVVLGVSTNDAASSLFSASAWPTCDGFNSIPGGLPAFSSSA